MAFCKTYDNGFRLVVNKIEGLYSVSVGVIVNTGSVNETEKNNGISHFIEHTVFKGTEKRSAFKISDDIDKIGAQINAFTSKELTCYYTKSTAEHFYDSAEVLSDIIFNAVFDEKELDKERGVIAEEINMSEDTPEDLCLDLLAESYYGKEKLGQTILGSIKNVYGFTKKDIESYMDKYYTADNVVLSVSGNVDIKEAEKIAEELFVVKFKRLKSGAQAEYSGSRCGNLVKKKQIEQSHIGLMIPAVSVLDDRAEALNVANTVLGGGMSSRLFQRVREELGLAYSVYSYPSMYKDSGVIEIYAGVNKDARDSALEEIIKEIKKFKKDGISKDEFNRGKEQIKSSFIMSRENTASQMLLFGKYLVFNNALFDFDKRIKKIDDLTEKDVSNVIEEFFDINKTAFATVSPNNKKLKIKL